MQRAAAWLLTSLLPMTVQAGKSDAVAVLDIQGTGIETELLPTLTEILTVEIDALNRFKVIAGRDIQAMLGFEKQKDVLGCTDAACLAEIGGALGVERIVAGHIGKVGSTFVVNIKLINIRMADTEGRVYETVRGEVDALIETIRKSVTKLFGEALEKDAKVAATTARPKPAKKTTAAAKNAAATAQTAPTPSGRPAGSTSEKTATASSASSPPPTVKKQAKGGGVGVWPIILWGGGAVMIAGGVLAGLQAKKLEDQAWDESYEGAQKAAEQAPQTAAGANALVGLGTIAIGAGVLVFLLSGDDADETAAWVPIITGNGTGIAYSGTF